jgi:hypothetical protein
MPYILGEGGTSDRDSLSMVTRKGNRIRNVKRSEASPDRIRAAVQAATSVCPNAKLRSATQVYNCMGLVFASRRTWIDVDEIPTILDDDGYAHLEGLMEAKVGDVVVYGDPSDGEISHVGIIVRKEANVLNASWDVEVMSQWGADGEYIHPLDHVPALLGVPFQFWTDRKALSS